MPTTAEYGHSTIESGQLSFRVPHTLAIRMAESSAFAQCRIAEAVVMLVAALLDGDSNADASRGDYEYRDLWEACCDSTMTIEQREGERLGEQCAASPKTPPRLRRLVSLWRTSAALPGILQSVAEMLPALGVLDDVACPIIGDDLQAMNMRAQRFLIGFLVGAKRVWFG